MASIAEERIRLSLMAQLMPHHTTTRRVVEELGLSGGIVRADVAVIEQAHLALYEIKSERDNTNRLPEQVRLYDQVGGFNYLVTHRVHLPHALEIVSPWWGVIVVDYNRASADMVAGIESGSNRQLTFSGVRPPQANPMVDPKVMVKLLWRDEAYKALRDRGLGAGHSGSSRAVLWKLLCQQLTTEELGLAVRQQLIIRKDWRTDTPYQKPPRRRRRRRKKTTAKKKP